MQTARIIQAVVLMIVIALAASCAATREYTSRLFAPRNPLQKDSAVAISPQVRFLEIDSAVENKDGWVTTDIIMGRDTSQSTYVLDNFSKSFPATPPAKDTLQKPETEKKAPPVLARKNPEENVPVARAANPGEVRTKRSRDDKQP